MAGIFKAYDIRGIYGKDLNEEIAYNIGRAFVSYLKVDKVYIGQDTRLSSPSLAKSLIEGITDQGADVVEVGLTTTDMFYFIINSSGAEAGITVTASHNPGEYNGFKLVRKNSAPIGAGSGIEEIEKIYLEQNFPPVSQKGKVEKQDDFLDKYIAYIRSKADIGAIKPLKVVMDAGNGMAGYVAPKMFADCNLDVVPLFFELDGSFPNHEANPIIEENRQDLIAKVRETGADFGVGFDGDSDRCFFVDENGHFIDGDFMTGLLATYMLEKNPGGTVFYDVRCSNYVKDSVKEASGRPFMWMVGHALAKPKMRQEKAIFGGEVSGHYYFYFPEYDSYADNSCLPVFIIAEMISRSGKKLSELLAGTQKYFISGEINSKVKDADQVMQEIENKYSSRGERVDIDGLSIIGDHWWFNIRKSNTEPLLRLNCEADTKEGMEAIRDELLGIIRA